MGDFLGYSCVWSVVMGCVFVVDLVCAWRMGDISGQVHGCSHVCSSFFCILSIAKCDLVLSRCLV